jgi:hypothetical protein
MTLLMNFQCLEKHSFHVHMSLNLTIAKGHEDNSTGLFSILNVILFRNPHQFPPVTCSIREALFYPAQSQHNLTLSQIGREVYLEFSMVVTLKQ